VRLGIADLRQRVLSWLLLRVGLAVGGRRDGAADHACEGERMVSIGA
jgi:hypothetical protein